MKRSLAKLMVVLAVFILVTGCGPTLEDIGIQKKDDAKPQNQKQELVTISISVANEDESMMFYLAGASDYDILVEGCASGFSGTATASTPLFQLYKYDQGCKAKLQQFFAYGDVWSPVDGAGFTAYAVGEIATFENSTATDTLRVKVVSQLASAIGSSEIVQYAWTDIAMGSNQNIEEVKGVHTLAVGGQSAPGFSVSALAYLGMTALGAGQFTFQLTCDVAMVGTVCGDVDLSEIKYQLVKDDYSSSLTIAQAAAIFVANSGSSIAIPGDQHASGNGGFKTIILDGPDKMHLNPHMILIFEAGGASYLYFNIDVSTIAY